MALTLWIDDYTGRRLDETELRRVHRQASRAYRANAHIFEDEADALAALGVVPMLRHL
jgi:hypothetical protein